MGEDQKKEGVDQKEEQRKEMIIMKMEIQLRGMEITSLTRMMRMVLIILLNL